MTHSSRGTVGLITTLICSARVTPALAIAAEPIPPHALPVTPSGLGTHAALAALSLIVFIFLGLLMAVNWRERHTRRRPPTLQHPRA